MKVWVSVHGRYHGFNLARELHRAGILAGVTTTYPASVARRWLPRPIVVRTAPWLEMLRRISAKSGTAEMLEAPIAESFGRFAARRISSDTDIFVGWSGASLEAIDAARAIGARVVIERGSTHIRHQAEILAAEYAAFGVDRMTVDPRLMAREIAEYDAADAIAVPSQFAATTFVAHGIPAEKLIVNPYGADIDRISSSSGPRENPWPRILFVGRVGLRKGVPWLLRAFACLKSEAELDVVGPFEADMQPILRACSLDRVALRGPLRSSEVDLAYATADIFCLPSIEEGFSLAMLQAMAAGLPVVVTAETGADEIVENGREGFVVPSRDSEKLGEALAILVRDRDRRHRMGIAARARVAAGFTWSDYGARMIGAYQRLLRGAASGNSLASMAQSE